MCTFRYLAIKELQEAYNKISTGKVVGAAGIDGTGANSSQLKRDIDECKVAIKKLAESISTVKNVLDKKIQDEIRKVRQFKKKYINVCEHSARTRN